MRAQSAVFLTYAAILLAALPLVVAHGDEAGETDMGGPHVTTMDPDSPTMITRGLENYFRHPHYVGWHLTHTVFMVLAWFIAMPLAIALSVGRSRHHLPAQIFFHILNGVGVFTAIVYNASTPDLYPNNSHHGLGWAVFGFTIAWTLMSFYVAYSEYKSKRRASLEQGKPLISQRPVAYKQIYNQDFDDDKDQEPEKQSFLGNNRVDRFISSSIQRFSTQRASQLIRFCQIVLEKLLLLLGFAALTSGFIVSGGLFRERQIFNGLAHYIKGGIFFWYSMLTLGRWMGAFTEFGWAWNVRPQRPLVSKWKSMVPSAEFTESFVIWLYGASNVFLEHLSNWGGEWTPSDLEHLSITILFFGGGLLGMLIECKWVRDLTNTTVEVQNSKNNHHLVGASRHAAGGATDEPGDRDPVSLNPMPALTIMLLGMMMGAHHQESMTSTMLHAQWGGLFSAFALARGVTYTTLYLKPPTSHFPSRPPSEIVASFCLCAGGILFMNSASDVVWAIESNGLDAMTIFTLSMGLTGIILAWEVVVFAIKEWAVRKERAAAGKLLAIS